MSLPVTVPGGAGPVEPAEPVEPEESVEPDGIDNDTREETSAQADQGGPTHIVGVADEAKSTDEPWSARWLDQVPLRVKLVAALLTLLAIALAVIGAASAFALRSHLLDRTDSQLKSTARTINLAAVSQQPRQVPLPTDYVVGVSDGNGGWEPLLYDSRLTPGDLPGIRTDVSAVDRHAGRPYTARASDGKYRWRILLTQVGSGETLILGQNLSDVDSAIGRVILVELLVGTAVLVALALVGVWLVRASLRPLVEMERTAAAIAGGDLTRRVPELDPRTELGRLSQALNAMLSQIESAFLARATSETAARAAESAARDAADAAKASEARALLSEERMRQFVADASHELRTPLTTIRGFAELYRQGAVDDVRDVLRRVEDEAARMGLLVEDLLLLARLDRERPIRHVPVSLADLIADAAKAAHAVAPDRTVEVELAKPTERLVVDGDEARLRQVVANLVTNALTHTPPGTSVALRLRPDGERHAVIEVSDSGPGLTPGQAERVFERFYRVDRARTRRAAAPASSVTNSPAPHSGAGLGLAIVAALVAAHNGTVEVDTAPGQGATFRVRLPLAPV